MRPLAIVALLSSAPVWAHPDYFPLQAGNYWVLQTTSSELLTIEVLRSRVEKGETYFLVSGYAPEPRWLRQAPDGALLAFDQASGGERRLAQLAFGGGEYKTSLSGCEQTARPAAAGAPHRGPNFDFEDSLTIAYQPDGCRDIGNLHETYAPGVGLVRRAITTFQGEKVFDLVYSRVNGSPVLGKSREIVLAYDFNAGSKGWLPGFADYNLRTGDLRMLAELRALPEEVAQNRSGLYIQSMNRSDDMFMFVKKYLSADDGIEPDRTYRVAFDIRMSSNAPSGCAGVGGGPGESVYLKAGASADEPLAALGEAGEVRLTIDKGQQAGGGKDAGVAGTIANGASCDGAAWPYVSVTRKYDHSYPVRTDDRASLWLLVGTDSGYEGLTGLYFESITVRIRPDLPAAPNADRVKM